MDVRAALDRVLASRPFSSSERLRRMLRFVVEATLAGRGDGLKEYVLGTEVCDRGADFDPRVDPVVRVEARRLRARLAEYYAAHGADDPLVIDLPKGGYVPTFERRIVPPATAPPPGDATSAPAPAGEADTEPTRSPPPTALSSMRRRWPWLAAAALAVVALAAWLATRDPARPDVPGNGVAVLPFQNASTDQENDYFCFGLVEDLTEVLSQVSGLRVVARTSSERFKGGHDLADVARQLRVRYIVEGSVRKTGDRLRITARLVDTSDASPIWASTFDRQLGDVFGVQDELARAIGSALVARIGAPAPPRRERRAPESGEAYALFLKGQFLNRTQPGAFDAAIAYLDQSIALDPTYAPAHFELASVYATRALDQIAPPPETVERARASVRRALALEPAMADALALEGWLQFFSAWDWAGAERMMTEALALNPSSATAHHRYALVLMTAGRFDEAVEHVRQALDRDPLSYRLGMNAAVVLFCARRYAEAERQARRALELAPRYFMSHLILASSLAEQHRWPESIEAYKASLDCSPGDPDAMASLGRVLALSGRRTEALAVRAQLDAPATSRPASRYELAYLEAALGERDRAIELLEQAIDRRETELVYLGVDPLFDQLRQDPRFERIVARVHAARP